MPWQKGKCHKFKTTTSQLNESHVSTSSEKPTPLAFPPAVFTLAKLRAYCRSRCDTTSKKQQVEPPWKTHLTTLQITFQVPQCSTFFSINDMPQKVSAINLPSSSFHENLFRSFGVQPHPHFLHWVFPSASRSIIFMSNSVAAIRNPRTKSCAPFPGVESQQ